MYTKFVIAVAGTASLAQAAIPGRTLADCEAVAARFDNTCSGGNPLSSFSGHSGADMSCTGSIRCPGGSGTQTYTSSNPCTWTRKLCVTCYEDGSDVRIRVQTNGLPNHCTTSTVNNGEPQETDWSAVFNADMTGIDNYSDSDFNSESKTTEILCDL